MDCKGLLFLIIPVPFRFRVWGFGYSIRVTTCYYRGSEVGARRVLVEFQGSRYGFLSGFPSALLYYGLGYMKASFKPECQTTTNPEPKSSLPGWFSVPGVGFKGLRHMLPPTLHVKSPNLKQARLNPALFP